MILFNDRFEFNFENDKLVLDFNSIEAVTLVGKKKMNIYTSDKTYQIFADVKLNLLKYMHMFYVINNRKGGSENEFLGL
jgi:hypothetical protein